MLIKQFVGIVYTFQGFKLLFIVKVYDMNFRKRYFHLPYVITLNLPVIYNDDFSSGELHL